MSVLLPLALYTLDVLTGEQALMLCAFLILWNEIR